MNDVLKIRYVKLHFTVQMLNDCIWPQNKVSAIRGGMGEMLLRANCIKDRNCEKCDFVSECVVQRTMYSKFDNKPDFIHVGDSVGYVIECENYETEFKKDDELRFNLILFGKTIVYFNQYLQAFFALGQNGVGKHKARFFITSVKNTLGEPILENQNVHMKYYYTAYLEDYVKYRLSKITPDTMINRIIFSTPVTIKHNGEFLERFDMQAIVRSLQRRLYILGCFENLQKENLEQFYQQELPAPDLKYQEISKQGVKRHSNRKNEDVCLIGLKGTIEVGPVDEALLQLLIAGEITHIGKNTSFGFGKYTVR